MTHRAYDVVCVGAQLPTLLAGALLAKRGFRVLLVAQDELPPTYEAMPGVIFPREPFTFTASGSPAARRVLAELALHQLFRRRAVAVDPAFQVCGPRHRLDFTREDALLEREIERELPEVKRPVEEFFAAADRYDALLDRVVDRDLMWPPQTFFERREVARALAEHPFGKEGDGVDPLAELAEDHPFRWMVDLPARFSDAMDPDHTTGLRTTRLFTAWRRGAAALDGGYGALRDMLVESVRTHGGEVRDPEKIDSIRVKRGTAQGVRVAASGEEIGASWIVVGAPLASLVRLVPDRAPFEELFERIGEPVVRYYRYTLNLRVDAAGVPEGMSRDVFFLRDPERPRVAANALRIQAEEADAEGKRQLCVEALIPRRGVEDLPDYVQGLRERIVASLGELVPFLGAHVEVMDSPHDLRGVQDLRAGLDRTAPEPWNRGPHTMRPVYGFPVTTSLGVCSLPVRAPIKRLVICNDQVVPGLGLEGRFLAAWSAARVISRADKKKEWMRRGRWGKLEL